MLKLPVAAPELMSSLTMHDPLHADRGTLRVTALGLESDPPRLRLAVELRHPRTTEKWLVRLPLDDGDARGDITPQAFVATVRAGLREWWDCKESDPALAALGQRVGSE